MVADGGGPSIEEELDDLEGFLVGKVLKKGPHHLSLEEVRQVHKSKTFPDEWRRQTGSAMPQELQTQITERVNRSAAPDPGNVPSDPAAQNAAFMRSVTAGEVEAVRRMLEGKGRRTLMSVVDDQMRCCTHHAAKQGHVPILQLLHDHGAEMEPRDKFGRTPIHLGCEFARCKTVDVLLGYGCRAEAEDKRGRNGLHLAACCEDPEICKLLIARRPNLVGSADSHRRTSLFFAVLNIHVQAQAEVTQALLQGQADVNARDAYGRTPLHYAAEENRKPAVNLLLKYRADAGLEDSVNHKTPLQLTTNEAIRRELRRALGAGDGGGQAASAGAAAPPPRAGGATKGLARGQSADHLGPGGGAAMEPGGGGGGGGQGVLKAPIALGVPFEQLQERFIRIMSRVQEGGIQQLEHVKSPHLFTGSWMVDVSSHQQLLGQAGVLKFVPGPEVAIRVFNLLRPPTHFPISRGDERDIIGYYGGVDGGRDGPTRAWEGDDPYRPAVLSPEEELSHARKSELMREIHNQRQEIESKDATIAEHKKKVEQLSTMLEGSITPEELKWLNDKLQEAERLVRDKDEELARLRSKCAELEGEKRVLAQQLQDLQTKFTDLNTAHIQVQKRLQAETEKKGEERSYKSVLEQERQQHQYQQQQLESELEDMNRLRMVQQTELDTLTRQLGEASVDRGQTQELTKLGAEVSQQRSQLTALRGELAQVTNRERIEAARAEKEAAKCKLAEDRADKVQKELEAARKETEAVRTQVELVKKSADQALEEKEKEVEKLMEEKARLQFPAAMSVMGLPG